MKELSPPLLDEIVRPMILHRRSFYVACFPDVPAAVLCTYSDPLPMNSWCSQLGETNPVFESIAMIENISNLHSRLIRITCTRSRAEYMNGGIMSLVSAAVIGMMYFRQPLLACTLSVKRATNSSSDNFK